MSRVLRCLQPSVAVAWLTITVRIKFPSSIPSLLLHSSVRHHRRRRFLSPRCSRKKDLKPICFILFSTFLSSSPSSSLSKSHLFYHDSAFRGPRNCDGIPLDERNKSVADGTNCVGNARVEWREISIAQRKNFVSTLRPWRRNQNLKRNNLNKSVRCARRKKAPCKPLAFVQNVG